jgi:hypothetical protein
MLGFWAAAIMLHFTAAAPGFLRAAIHTPTIVEYGSSETCHSIWKSDPAADLTFCAGPISARFDLPAR